MRFAIHAEVTDETFARLRHGRAATGQIFLTIGQQHFPAERWDDFVLALLGAWISNALLFEGFVVEIENRFMDGPWSFRVRREPGAAALTVMGLRGGEVTTPTVQVPVRRYFALLRGAAKSVLNDLRAGGVSEGVDVDDLRRKLRDLIELEARLRAS